MPASNGVDQANLGIFDPEFLWMPFAKDQRAHIKE